MFRYLFGPVRAAYADTHLARQRQAGESICFHSEPGVDLRIGLNDTWDEVVARLPADWKPDAIVLALDYASIPAAVWSQPSPVIGLATDWDLLWHHYQRQLRLCDLVLMDAAGVERMQKAGFSHAQTANLAGCSKRFLETRPEEADRDIDILFVGNLNPNVQGSRLPLLGRLARLGRKHQVAFHTALSDADYVKLLRRARIVFNRSRHRTCNRRTFEAAASGALLFQEEGNREVADLLPDREACIFYRDDNLESLLDHYLTHDDERQAIAGAGQKCAANLSFENVWDTIVRQIEAQAPELQQTRAARQAAPMSEELMRRGHEAFVCPERVDPQLPIDVEQAVLRFPKAANLRLLLGLVTARYVSRDDPAIITAESAAFHFQQALEMEPAHPTAGLYLAEALDAAGRRAAAVEQAKKALQALAQKPKLDPETLDGGHFPLGFSLFRMEWERAGWKNAGAFEAEARVKVNLLRFRLNALLAEWTGDPVHAYEAHLARPDLSAATAGLGQALIRAGHIPEAIPHLNATLERNPFQRVAARNLFAALGQIGDREGQLRLAQERNVFAQVAPQTVPREDWFGKAAVDDSSARGAAPTAPATPRIQPRVSLTMIVRNEEANLPGLLRCVHDLLDDIVVVDTGSQDRTKDVAAEFGARVFDFPWIDNFAAARNEALRHANGEWIIWLDADDRIDEENRGRLRQLFASLGDENDAYSLKVRSAMDEERSSFRILDQVRMFRRHPKIFWKYRVHEQILWAVRQLNGGVRWADVVIDHVGYQDGGVRKGKLHRNFRLLELEAKENPNDAFVLFNLGWTTLDLERPDEALPRLQRALKYSAPDSSILRKLYALLIRTHRQLGQAPQALSACHEGRSRFPDDSELLFEEAILKNEARDLAGAADSLLRLLEVKPGRFFASVDPSLRGFKTRHMLADLYREMGRLNEAERQWRLAVTENPEFVPSWVGLGNLYCKAQRWDDFGAVLAHLDRYQPDSIDAGVLRARQHLTRREFAAARNLLEGVIQRVPRALGPRVLLTHVLLQEGQDLVGAETALRDVLTLDPDHQEARKNLSVLLRNKKLDR